MMDPLFLMPFLYFPEDKSEYIPAAIQVALFMLLAFLAFLGFGKLSRKEGLKTKELEERIRKERAKEQSQK